MVNFVQKIQDMEKEKNFDNLINTRKEFDILNSMLFKKEQIYALEMCKKPLYYGVNEKTDYLSQKEKRKIVLKYFKNILSGSQGT